MKASGIIGMLGPSPKLVVHREVQLLAAQQCKHCVHGITLAQFCSFWSRDCRLPMGSSRVMAQPLPPGFSPAALLCVESSQQMITALRRACFKTAHLVLAPRSGICTKPCVRQPLWAVGPGSLEGSVMQSGPVSQGVKAPLAVRDTS